MSGSGEFCFEGHLWPLCYAGKPANCFVPVAGNDRLERPAFFATQSIVGCFGPWLVNSSFDELTLFEREVGVGSRSDLSQNCPKRAYLAKTPFNLGDNIARELLEW